jgi:hypothetical protein
MRKPFDILADGLYFTESRGDWTPVELFRRAAASLAPPIRRLIFSFEAPLYRQIQCPPGGQARSLRCNRSAPPGRPFGRAVRD